jgi:hypothetical protein
MVQESSYCEEQSFNQPLPKAIVYICLAISLGLPVYAYATDQFSAVTLIAIPIAGGVFFLFRTMKLFVRIDADKISYRFRPFHSKAQVIAKTQIKLVMLTRYRPLTEYGGWGIRYGRNSRAYSVSGQYGMRLSLLNTNKDILIGTSKPHEVLSALIRYEYPVTEMNITAH